MYKRSYERWQESRDGKKRTGRMLRKYETCELRGQHRFEEKLRVAELAAPTSCNNSPTSVGWYAGSLKLPTRPDHSGYIWTTRVSGRGR